MTEKEKEAIEQLKSWREFIIKNKEKVNKASDIEFYLRIALNLIQRQQEEIDNLKKQNTHQSKEIKKAVDYTFELNKENEKKDKIIDAMAEEIDKTTSEKYKIKHICEDGKCGYEECHEDDWNECIKRYFEMKVNGNDINVGRIESEDKC